MEHAVYDGVEVAGRDAHDTAIPRGWHRHMNFYCY